MPYILDNFEISLAVFLPNTIAGHAITYTNNDAADDDNDNDDDDDNNNNNSNNNNNGTFIARISMWIYQYNYYL